MDFLVWNAVNAGHGNLIEVQTQWSIDDLLDSNEMLAINKAYQKEAEDQSPSPRKK